MTIKTRITRYLAFAALALSLLTPAVLNADMLDVGPTPALANDGESGGNGTGC